MSSLSNKFPFHISTHLGKIFKCVSLHKTLSEYLVVMALVMMIMLVMMIRLVLVIMIRLVIMIMVMLVMVVMTMVRTFAIALVFPCSTAISNDSAAFFA